MLLLCLERFGPIPEYCRFNPKPYHQIFPCVTILYIHYPGAIQFEHVMKNLGQDDPEVARLHAQVRSYFLPAVVIPPSSHPM